ncbi:MAG: acetate--CoA ligase family protein [Firmicutes bacterium]|nr:acetate--CoA ligase family protein [Bacillota bacterium]
MSHPVVDRALREGRDALREWEAYELCDAYGIPHPRWELANTEEEAVAASLRLGNPVVLKVSSLDVLHKSDVGGVLVGLRGEQEIRDGFRRLREEVARRAAHTRWEGVLVQPLVAGSAEVVVGGLRDPQFGPVVMVGSGGVLVEVLRDVAFRLAPLDREEALRQIQETACYRLLQGVRGRPPADLEAVADVLVRAGQLLLSEPHVRELDLNPVVAGPEGCWAVDARVLLDRAGYTS